MNDLHVSAVMASLRGPERKTVMKYYELYGCTTMSELVWVVCNNKRPAGVGFIKKHRLLEWLFDLKWKEEAK